MHSKLNPWWLFPSRVAIVVVAINVLQDVKAPGLVVKLAFIGLLVALNVMAFKRKSKAIEEIKANGESVEEQSFGDFAIGGLGFITFCLFLAKPNFIQPPVTHALIVVSIFCSFLLASRRAKRVKSSSDLPNATQSTNVE